MASAPVSLPQLPAFSTSRRDAWWLQPLITFAILSAFIVYATWAALQGAHYSYGPYLSPFYSPLLFSMPGAPNEHAWFGEAPAWMASLPMFSPAMLILWAPGGFRFTCYYYRGAYYKAFWADPVSCAVSEPKFRGTRYRGEHSFPLILQNIHRYFLYVALLFLFFLAYDVWVALWHDDPKSGTKVFGVGVGTIVLLLNVVFLGSYTLSCHSFRHIVGGGLDILSGKPVRKKAYDCVTCINKKHMVFAWISLFWVAFSDVYVRLCSMEIWSDWRIL